MAFILSMFLSIVFTFVIYNVNDLVVYESLKRGFYKLHDETFIYDSSKALALSQICVKSLFRMRKSVFFKSKYHVLVREITDILEQIPYE